MIGILALLGFGGIMAKQEIERTNDCIRSRDRAKREGRDTYVDGYGCTRWTENAHLIIWSQDHEGYACWYDIDDQKIIDRFGYRNHLKHIEETKRICVEMEKERLRKEKEEEYRKKRMEDEIRKKYGRTAQDTINELFYQRLGYKNIPK